MKSEELIRLKKDNREIEFTYNNCRYSITYYNDSRPSVCKFYTEPIDVATAEEVLRLTISNKTIKGIFETLPNEETEVF